MGFTPPNNTTSQASWTTTHEGYLNLGASTATTCSSLLSTNNSTCKYKIQTKNGTETRLLVVKNEVEVFVANNPTNFISYFQAYANQQVGAIVINQDMMYVPVTLAPSTSNPVHMMILTREGNVNTEQKLQLLTDVVGQLSQEVKNLKEALNAHKQESKVVTKRWTPSAESGTSTSFSALPTDMSLQFTTTYANQSVAVFGSISRVQHSSSGINTTFQIVIDGTIVACEVNTGGRDGWSFDAVHLHGGATIATPGIHTAQVRYCTQSGTCHFVNDGSGLQSRNLTVIVEHM